MRRFSLWFLVFLVLVLEVTLFRWIEIMGVRPDAMVIALVYIALALGPTVGTLLGFLIGLARLSILSASFESMPLAGTLVGFLVGKYCTKIMYENYLVQALILVGSVLVMDSVNLAWADPGRMGYWLLRFSLPGAVYTAVVGVATAVVVERAFGLRLIA
jgi:rod shape-determining protein MreD